MKLSSDDNRLESARSYIAKVDWIYAKTYKTAPHEYTLRKAKPELDADFKKFVDFIRSEGHDEQFWNKTYRYLNIDGYQYWTMHAPKEETILINRAKIT
jgi:hypothetical protein